MELLYMKPVLAVFACLRVHLVEPFYAHVCMGLMQATARCLLSTRTHMYVQLCKDGKKLRR